MGEDVEVIWGQRQAIFLKIRNFVALMDGELRSKSIGVRLRHAGCWLASSALANVHLTRLPFIVTTVASAESRRSIAMKSFICPQILSPLPPSAGFRFKGFALLSR
jgi:hypothetical protein